MEAKGIITEQRSEGKRHLLAENGACILWAETTFLNK